MHNQLLDQLEGSFDWFQFNCGVALSHSKTLVRMIVDEFRTGEIHQCGWLLKEHDLVLFMLSRHCVDDIWDSNCSP